MPRRPRLPARRSSQDADTVYLLSGSGHRGCGDGKASSATFNTPMGICALGDALGTVAISDVQNNTLRFVAPDKHRDVRVTSLRSSPFLGPRGLGCSADGNLLYVCDTGHNTIKFGVVPDQFVEDMDFGVLAGTGRRGHGDGPALTSSFHHPSSLCVTPDGIFVTDTGNHCIRFIYQAHGKWRVDTVAGGPTTPVGTGSIGRRSLGATPLTPLPGYVDGPGDVAMFRGPSGITVGPTGVLLVADTFNHCIRGIVWADSGWHVYTVAGAPKSGHVDGCCSTALFNQPVGICIGEDETVFVADKGNNCVRQLGGVVAAVGLCRYSWVRTISIDEGAPNWTFPKGREPPFLLPKGLCVLAPQHSWYHCRQRPRRLLVGVCDTGNHLVRVLSIESSAEELAPELKRNGSTPAEENQADVTEKEEHVSEIRDLREENARLKSENETYRHLLELAVAKMNTLSIQLEAKHQVSDQGGTNK
ncbi:hypothetical protein ACHHYP_05315 [Achlya hypogyna]|uniref:NHL repeat containing protein n=1 Tax=Achlya hypogyna TaxID=1202772 RepID=A0A1V9YYA7_ACHHY|nr:hypothetical protein ACHHYP_05315 [Achlya hypogyna]